MKALFVGAGKNLGQVLRDRLQNQGWEIWHITSGDSGNERDLVVDWQRVKESDLQRWLHRVPDLDLVFFNQNSSSLDAGCFSADRYTVLQCWKQIGHWRQSHYVSCQLPFQIIHALGARLHQQSRVCWMLSCMVARHRHNPGYADYIANKFQNWLMIQNFARHHPACFLGIEPGDSVRGADLDGAASQIHHILEIPASQANGNVYAMDGKISQLYSNLG